MNKQRKVVITTTYNEMGIIIDTKAEEVAQPNLQPTCNNLATDCISRAAAINTVVFECGEWTGLAKEISKQLRQMPSVQPDKLTDKEQRIFLSAMGREEEVCKEVDDAWRDCREPY